MPEKDDKPANRPLRLESVDNDEKYRIFSEKGIASILRSMKHHNTLATCYFDDSDNFMLTSVIHVDADEGEMVLDYGTDEASNQRALETDTLSVVAFLDQVKIQFVCQGIEKIQFDERDAFLARIPETLLRIQKREFYRIETPALSPVKCVIPLTEGDKAETAEVVLEDISCGGIAVIDLQSTINFEVGTRYRNCLIELPEVGTARVDLRVKHVSETLRGSNKVRRARCEYIDTLDSMLSLIQRYISKLEQKRK
jgi:c-di-GMP-binding flagellar brake protein YcgR